MICSYWTLHAGTNQTAALVSESQMFTSAEKDAILEGVGKYNDKFIKASVQKIYRKAVQANNLQFRKLGELKTLLGDAKKEREEVLAELPQVFSQKRSCQEEPEGVGQRKKLQVNDDDGDMVQSDFDRSAVISGVLAIRSSALAARAGSVNRRPWFPFLGWLRLPASKIDRTISVT
jgi:hypothetical protein